MLKKMKIKNSNLKLGEYITEVQRIFKLYGFQKIKIEKELVVLARRNNISPTNLVRCIWHKLYSKVTNARFAQLVDNAHRNFIKNRP